MELNGKSNRGEENRTTANVDQMASSAHGTVDKVASGAHRAVDRIVGAAGSAAESLSQRREQMATAGTQLVEDVRSYVQANPLASIGIAAAIGFVFSRIVAPRSGSD